MVACGLCGAWNRGADAAARRLHRASGRRRRPHHTYFHVQRRARTRTRVQLCGARAGTSISSSSLTGTCSGRPSPSAVTPASWLGDCRGPVRGARECLTGKKPRYPPMLEHLVPTAAGYGAGSSMPRPTPDLCCACGRQPRPLARAPDVPAARPHAPGLGLRVDAPCAQRCRRCRGCTFGRSNQWAEAEAVDPGHARFCSPAAAATVSASGRRANECTELCDKRGGQEAKAHARNSRPRLPRSTSRLTEAAAHGLCRTRPAFLCPTSLA